ncbi:MAG: phage tail length tape measure family protein [Citrobacter portucalensis]|nr:phage tail length tape measure family protein [Citrobacter portucalensis]
MAEEVGGIVYEVGMDVKGLTSGGAAVNKVLQDIEKSIDDSIAGINKLDSGLKNTGETAVKAGRNLSGLNNAMRQGGYQIQDFVVQVQGGQSALVALSQQGSQLLGVFGAGGAVAGALLTIGTVIVGSLIAGMDNAAVSTKALTAAQQRLADIFQVSSNGVVVLSDKFAKLAEVSENAARAQLTMALIDANNIIKASVQGVNELGDALGTWKAPLSAAISQMDALKGRGIDVNQALKELGGTYEGNILGLNQLNQVVGEVSKSFGISSEDAVKLVQALADVRQNANPETIAALRDVTVDLSQKYGYANKALSEFTGKVGEYSIKSDQAAESTRLATDMLDGHRVASEEDARATEDNTNKLKSYIQAIQDEGATIALSARQKAIYKAGTLGASKADLEAIDAAYDSIEAFKKQQEEQKKAEQERRKAESDAATAAKSAASQQESVAQKLEQLRQKSMLAATSTAELSREQQILTAQQSLGNAATEAQKKLAGEYAAQAYDVAAALKAQQAAEKQKQDTEKNYSAIRKQASPVSGLDDQFQQQMASLNAYATLYPAKIAEVEATRATIEQQYRDQRMAAMWAEWQQQNMAAQLFGEVLDTSLSTVSNSITGVLTGTQSLNDSLLNIATTVLNTVVNSFVQMGAEWVKSAIMGQTAQVAATAATTAAQTAGLATTTTASVASAATTTAAWTPAAIVASIGSFGGAAAIGLGAVLGALAMGVAGKRKNGGPMSAGGLYEVGENGLPEIFQASNGRQYMVPGNNGQMFSNKDVTSGGASSGGLVVYNNITNNANARVSSSATQNSDGSLTISTIVDDIMANGQIGQAISQTYDTQRKANE